MNFKIKKLIIFQLNPYVNSIKDTIHVSLIHSYTIMTVRATYLNELVMTFINYLSSIYIPRITKE